MATGANNTFVGNASGDVMSTGSKNTITAASHSRLTAIKVA